MLKTTFVLIALLATVVPPCCSQDMGHSVPVIHHTDLYHPHNDPDDHWDLATLYGLMMRGNIDLKGIFIDHPLNAARESNEPTWGDPALCAVGQLNHLCGSAVPAVVGSSNPFDPDTDYASTGSAGSGVDFLLKALEESPEPIAITVTGSCRDIAIAGKAAPDLFREKCRGIYLNAGTGTTDPAKGANQEWNVLLEPEADRAVFEIPCPIYWVPCFEAMDFQVATYGSYWTFNQREILPALSEPLQNFFLYALTQSEDPKWLRYLDGKPDPDLMKQFSAQRRNMWCTAGFLHMAGLTCNMEGTIHPADSSVDSVFGFEPISMTLGEEGVKDWKPDPQSTDRFIFKARDVDRYSSAMTAALKTVLSEIAPSEVKVRIEDATGPLVSRTFAILKDRIEHRCSARVIESASDAEIVLTIDADLPREAFSIEEDRSALKIAGGSAQGLLYGVGKFLRTSGYENGFHPSEWRGTSVPRGSMRGMYFASHFHNWYQTAPEEEIARYMEDLALWGVNAIKICFPFLNFKDWDDPEADKAVEMTRRYARLAHDLGLQFGIGAGNTFFSGVPDHLRATRLPDPTHRRGNHGNPVCPSIPEGHEFIMEQMEELFDRLDGVGLDFLVFWPYDEGGCGCDQCSPWGSNGFLKLSQELTRLARKHYPELKTVLSTWVFDTPPAGEWEGLSKTLAEGNDWLDYILADSHEEFPRYPLDVGVPGDLPLINFPEISMWGNWPWGGVGANPLPSRFQHLWDSVKQKVSGGFPYSEGIYEDLNKAVVVQYYWDADRTARETLSEYIAYEFSPEVTDDVLTLIDLLESTASHSYRKEPVTPSEIERAYELAESVNNRLPDWAKKGWRWEIVQQRAILDREKYIGDGLETPEAEAALLRLMEIYHSQMETEDPYHHRVRPPLKRAVSLNGNK
ncbi:MAG: nucleoside hydrolase [Candidatus Omnitrophica bacterium]|nr:nucleoside hydrolase [Candidatus Omnitrophota bacterium]